MTKKLFVGNLPDGCTKEELEGLMKRFGTVAECDVILNKNFGFVHMNSETEAQEAVTQLDSSPFMGNIIKVQFSTTDVHKTPGVGSKGECFRCGSKGHLSRDCDQGGGSRGNRGRGGRGGRGGFRGGRGFGRDPYREDRGRPPYRGYGNGYADDYYRDDRPPMRRGMPRDFDFERRYLDDAYSRRMPLSMREYELLYRSRDRSPIRGYDRPLYSSRSDIYDRLYSSRSSAGYYDMPLRSEVGKDLMPGKLAGPAFRAQMPRGRVKEGPAYAYV